MCSPWTSINVLMLDHRRVAVEASQPTLHRALKGFEPLPMPFLAYGPFGGAFHCATLDTRRSGALENYFQLLTGSICADRRDRLAPHATSIGSPLPISASASARRHSYFVPASGPC